MALDTLLVRNPHEVVSNYIIYLLCLLTMYTIGNSKLDKILKFIQISYDCYAIDVKRCLNSFGNLLLTLTLPSL